MADRAAPTVELVPEPASRYRRGQAWRYKARQGEEASRAIVGRVERAERIGVIVHVQLTDMAIRNPHVAGGMSRIIGHVPISERAMDDSVLEVTDEARDLDGFEAGYETWRASFLAGKAGVFSVSLCEVAGFMEQALGGGAAEQGDGADERRPV